MKSRMILATTWVMSQPGRLQAIVVGGLVVAGVLVGLAQPEVALAGSATGGSR